MSAWRRNYITTVDILVFANALGYHDEIHTIGKPFKICAILSQTAS